MPIYIGSRHEFDPVYSLDCPDDNTHEHLTLFANTFNANRATPDMPIRYHVVVDGDRLDDLAFKYYGNSTRWWFIADANPDTAYDPMSLTPGSLLRIPNASE